MSAIALTDGDLDRKIRASLTAVDVAMAETVAEAWKAGIGDDGIIGRVVWWAHRIVKGVPQPASE